MDISAINRTVQVPHVPEPAIPVGNAAENRDAVQSVKALNATGMFGQDSELTFERDPLSHQMVVQLIDRKTKEVLSQIPKEYILRLDADLKPPSS